MVIRVWLLPPTWPCLTLSTILLKTSLNTVRKRLEAMLSKCIVLVSKSDEIHPPSLIISGTEVQYFLCVSALMWFNIYCTIWSCIPLRTLFSKLIIYFHFVTVLFFKCIYLSLSLIIPTLNIWINTYTVYAKEHWYMEKSFWHSLKFSISLKLDFPSLLRQNENKWVFFPYSTVHVQFYFPCLLLLAHL